MYIFELNVLQVLNLPEAVQDEDQLIVMWRRGQGAKATKKGIVLEGCATISDKINLRAKMDYDASNEMFLSKTTQIQLKHVQTDEVIAETDLDLADYIDVDLNSYDIELDDLVPRAGVMTDSDEEEKQDEEAQPQEIEAAHKNIRVKV